MRQISVYTNLIARCGLCCGACKRCLKDSCPGCTGNENASRGGSTGKGTAAIKRV